MPNLQIATLTADNIWQMHREILGGVSSETGVALSTSIDACPAVAQATHWALAYMCSRLRGETMPARPAALGAYEAARVASIVDKMLGERVAPAPSML